MKLCSPSKADHVNIVTHICIIPAGTRCPCSVNTRVDMAASEHVRGPSPCRPGVGAPPRPGTHVTVHSVFAPGRRGAPCGQERGWPRGETEPGQGVSGRPWSRELILVKPPHSWASISSLSQQSHRTHLSGSFSWKQGERGQALPSRQTAECRFCPVSLSPLFKSRFSLETPSLCLYRLKKGFQRDREVSPREDESSKPRDTHSWKRLSQAACIWAR